MNIKEELTKIFREVFDDDSIILRDDMTADDIEDWDSLAHMELIELIEKKFNIHFTTKESLETENVGSFISLIENKINS